MKRQPKCQPHDAIRAALGDAGFVSYCRGCQIKYAWRAGLKDAACGPAPTLPAVGCVRIAASHRSELDDTH